MSPSAALFLVLILVAAIGHVFFWVGLNNWLHSLGIPHRWIGFFSATGWAAMFGLPLALAGKTALALAQADQLGDLAAWIELVARDRLAIGYSLVCYAAVLREVVLRRRSILHAAPADVLRGNDSTELFAEPNNYRRQTRGVAAVAVRLPGNQLLRPLIQEKTLALASLSPALAGLTIAHLSDLHLSGRIGPEFFSEIAARTTDWGPDLIAITGDIMDRDACLDWLPETLGRLTAPLGVYFVLGNHDLRVDAQRLRAALVQLGAVDLGRAPCTISFRGAEIHLAGNELPWFRPPTAAPPRGEASPNAEDPNASRDAAELRILLAHSPDQVHWAQRRGVDLMLAGHTHGGQIRLPLLGPLVSPSRYGGCYAGGTYLVGSLVMHVSRGLSSMSPVRWNCPPELALLRLETASDKR